MQLLALLRSVSPFMDEKTSATVWHGENISGTFMSSKDETSWSDECSHFMFPDPVMMKEIPFLMQTH
ncbi:hypothetical protein Xszus_04126 [Xenorhabdus szentirmaii]|uniref:Uncharacterized protein n=2 Tax=Xenorhabdus szentirmaii TaxID=290112 RepID=W1J1N3_9GAMM|nr:hypothetical protein [Xenorhabdus sp. ZM]MBD2803393.1 hypothetical protein [Xenorhabdus sp. ZM]PHM35479.1 hypothetical protein Xsze_01950 [Xenorhabdus szentirmaii DSM 16338]PHM44296.1 hypothetical protein Xszus_04126 [Xenorhabdus szentirmaii]CDL84657.1 hypothetical protein XSR1_50061 [Xenorhabdus szentirmaii DSM 16338]